MRRSAQHAVLLFGLLSIVLAIPLLAQATYLRDRDRELEGRKRLLEDLQRARFRFGPFYLLSRIELRDLGYDEAIHTPTREELDDLTITVAAPHKLYFVPRKKLILSAQVDPAYVWFRERKELRNWNYLYRGDVHVLRNRIYLDAFAARSDETVRDLSELSQLVNRETRFAGVDTEYKFSSKTEFLLRHLVTDIDYSEQVRRQDVDVARLERIENRSTFKLRHKTFPRTALSVSTEVQNFDFDSADNRDGDLVALYAGAERTGSGVRLIEQPIQVRIGYAELDYDDPTEKDYRGPLGSATVSWLPYEHLVLTVTGERQLEFSIFENNNHYAADRFRLVANYTFAERLDLVGTIEQGANQYFEPAFDTTDGRVKKREDDIGFRSVGVRYRLARQSSVGVGVGYYERRSNFPEFSEDGIRLLVQLSISP